jgi:hypothetical protein
MASPRKIFTLEIALDYAGAPIGKVSLSCIAYLYADGTFRTIDINSAMFLGTDIAGYVSAAQPDLWDEWEGAAEDHFRAENPESDELPADNYADHERPSTLF